MAFRIDCTNERVILELEGDNSVETAAELHQQLLAAQAASKAVTVKAQQSGAIDLTVVQILAALQTCSPELRIERPSEEFLASLDRCGMRRHVRAALRQEKREKGEQP
jgi:ABC-type transporter Mla MlaB component